MLHDTTEFSFTHNTPDGYLSYFKGRHGTHTACGLLMHSSLAVTTDGLPLGLAAVTFWSRRGMWTNAAKRAANPMTIPIEQKESVCWFENVTRSTHERGDPGRCVHVGDRVATSSSCSTRPTMPDALPHATAVDRLAGRGASLFPIVPVWLIGVTVTLRPDLPANIVTPTLDDVGTADIVQKPKIDVSIFNKLKPDTEIVSNYEREPTVGEILPGQFAGIALRAAD